MPWGDGEYTFRLGIAERLEVELQVGRELAKVLPENAIFSGLPSIYQRIVNLAYTTKDVNETLLRGLIGGSTKPAEAARLVGLYGVGARPDAESLPVVQKILEAAIFAPPGIEAAASKKAEAAASETTA